MKGHLPNLELLEYIAKGIVMKDTNAVSAISGYYHVDEKLAKSLYFELHAVMFEQLWGSTNTAFDINKEGKPLLGGQSMTSAYTTVFWEEVSQTYVVFVDNRFCYKVTNPTKMFMDDLKNHSLKAVSEASKLY